MPFLYLFLLAFISTCWGYSFGQSDHLEHLPVLFRLLDDSFLLNDDFVNDSLRGYNPRRLFFYILLPFCQLFGVAPVYFVGTFLTNFLTARISYLLANLLFDNRNTKTVGFISALLVMGLYTVGLGENDYIKINFFLPSGLGAAITFYSLYWGLKQQYIRLGIGLGLGALIHPLLCPLFGGIYWTGLFLQRFYNFQFNLKAYQPLLYGFFSWLLISLSIILPYYIENFATNKINAVDFVHIYAHFRCPHHFLPSWFFPNEQNISLSWLGVYFLLIYFIYKQHLTDIKQLNLLVYISMFIFLLLPFGYYFVEICPSRLFATIQVFRFLFIPKQLVLIFAAGYIYFIWQQFKENSLSANKIIYNKYITISTYFISLLDPLRLIYIQIIQLLAFYYLRNDNYKNNLIYKTTLFIFFTAYIIFIANSLYFIAVTLLKNEDEAAKMVFYLYLCAIFLPMGFAYQYKKSVSLYLCTHLLLFSLYYFNNPRQAAYKGIDKHISYQFTLSQIPNDKQNISNFIKNNTAADIRLLTPPNFSELRLTANRTVLIDFKTFPFEDISLQRWYKNIMDIYGQTDKLGFEAVRWAFVPNYLYSTELSLMQKALKYNCTHLILYQQTPTTQPILYQDSLYKLIKITVQ